jgi:hypothetical protein
MQLLPRRTRSILACFIAVATISQGGAAAAPPDRLAEIRAVEVLERPGTPAARRLLDQLVQGEAEDPLTVAALNARRRLDAPAGPPARERSAS